MEVLYAFSRPTSASSRQIATESSSSAYGIQLQIPYGNRARASAGRSRRVLEEKRKARDDEQGVIEGTGEALKIHLKESIEIPMHSTDVRTLLGDRLIDKGSARNFCVLPAKSVLIPPSN
jgi:hypothetical protein